MLAAHVLEFAIRPDGWIHHVEGGFDVPRGPVGVLAYLVFVPAFWLMPARGRVPYIVLSALFLTLATVGPAFMLTLAALAAVGFLVVRAFANQRLYWLGWALLVGGYAALLLHPQPAWLPPVREPLYFYVHWAGIGYLFLKTLHVFQDVSRGKLRPPRSGEWLAYALFAPSLRMGPLYRYGEFTGQLNGDLRKHRDLGAAGLRIFSGLARLGLLGVLIDKVPIDVLFDDPGRLSTGRFVASIYLAPLSFFLWISGYTELGVGIGRAMGFVVPENFNYPWFSVNIGEFWQRWHITLGAWLREYVFNALIRRRWHFFWGFTITFLLCGLWHGPRWCYIIWGTAQGVGLAVLRLWSQYWKRQQTRGTPLHRRLAAAGLVNSRFSAALAWLLTFHYEIVTIMIGMDLNHAGRRVGERALRLLWGAWTTA